MGRGSRQTSAAASATATVALREAPLDNNVRWQEVDSSFISRIGFESFHGEDNCYLYVEMKPRVAGGSPSVYRYRGVSEGLFRSLNSSDSTGRDFREYVRDSYACERISPPSRNTPEPAPERWHEIESSLVQSAAWEDGDLFVELVGGPGRATRRYRYDEVPPETMNGLLAASSPGQYFNHAIRNNFDFEQIS